MQTMDVRGAAQRAVNQSKSFLSKQVDETTTRFGAQIGSVARDLHDIGDELRKSGASGPAARYVDQGADLIEGLGHYLKDADAERLFGDVERHARKQPLAFAAEAIAVGFATSRFLKATSAPRDRNTAGAPSRVNDALSNVNPLGLALGGLAIGVLAGLLTPVTEYERRRAGRVREGLVHGAQDMGSNVLEHGKRVLAEAAQTAVREAMGRDDSASRYS